MVSLAQYEIKSRKMFFPPSFVPRNLKIPHLLTCKIAELVGELLAEDRHAHRYPRQHGLAERGTDTNKQRGLCPRQDGLKEMVKGKDFAVCSYNPWREGRVADLQGIAPQNHPQALGIITPRP